MNDRKQVIDDRDPRVGRDAVAQRETGSSAAGGLAEAPGRWMAPAHGSPVARILMVNRFFPPDEAPTAQLLGDLAASLVRSGIAPTVIAGRPRHSDPQPTVGPGVTVRHVWTGPLGLPGILGRISEYLSFALGATRHLLREVRRDDLVVVKTDPPLMSIVVGGIARRRGAAVVNWCQDLFPEIAAAVGIPLTRGAIGRGLLALRLREQRSAVLNVAISESMAARLRAEGVPADRIAIIPNWVDEDAIVPVDHATNRWRREQGLADRFVIGYSGNLGRVHDPELIFALIRRMAGHSDVVFAIVGGGTGNVVLQRRVARAGLTNVRFLPYQPKDRLAESLSAMDLHLVSLRPACEGLSFPSKLVGVFAVGRPVLFIGDPAGEVARVVRSSGAGLAVDGADAAAMERAVATLRAEAEARGRAGRRFFEQRFSMDRALASWLACLGLHRGTVAGAAAVAPTAPADEPALELAAGFAQSGGGRPGR